MPNTAEWKEIQVRIKDHVGNKVKYDYDNDGGRTKLEQPYRPKWRSAKFRLPSGKPKHETFAAEMTDKQILELIQKKYSNYQFTQTANPMPGSPNIVEWKDWLFVSIPDDAETIELHEEYGDVPVITYHTKMGTDDYDILRETLILGSWQIIGKGDENIWEGIVESRQGKLLNSVIYKDYKEDDEWYHTATKSGHSLLKSLGMEPSETLVLKKGR